MINFKVTFSDLVFRSDDLELLKPIIERAYKTDSKWVGSGKPNIDFVRPARLSDVNVSLICGDEVEVMRMWYEDNVLDKA